MIRRSTWVVLGLFLLVLGLGWYLQRGRGTAGPEVTPTLAAQRLLDLNDAEINALLIRDSQANEIQIDRDAEGVWTLAGLTAEETDQSRVETALQQLSNLSILTELESPPPLADLGLETPAYSITLVSVDGSRQQLLVGDETPTGSGYYLTLEGGQPRVVNKFGVDTVTGLLTTRPILPTPIPSSTMGPETPYP